MEGLLQDLQGAWVLGLVAIAIEGKISGHGSQVGCNIGCIESTKLSLRWVSINRYDVLLL
jgi:hypothetical protein